MRREISEPMETTFSRLMSNMPTCEKCGAMVGWSRGATGLVTLKPCALCAEKEGGAT